MKSRRKSQHRVAECPSGAKPCKCSDVGWPGRRPPGWLPRRNLTLYLDSQPGLTCSRVTANHTEGIHYPWDEFLEQNSGGGEIRGLQGTKDVAEDAEHDADRL